ncbi:MAG: acetyl-CoA carboxylase, biotin carboxylase subunit, partial [Ilumatobacteraceae bacterium]
MTAGTQTSTLRRVLVANRGEIAVRIIRACRDEGVEVVVAVSEADQDSLAARLADGIVHIGLPSPTQSYLRVGQIVCAALLARCDAVHPGYGFLAEQPALAEACAANGLVFVGPGADVIRRGGDKVAARAAARR